MNPNWAATAPATNTPEWDDLMANLGLTPSNRPTPLPRTPRPIRHGTASGATVHRKRGETVCPACRNAWNTYQRNHYHRTRNKENAA